MQEEVGKNEEDYAKLSQDFHLFSFMKYIFPSIFTFIFIAAYQIVDGVFIEKYVDELAISVVNLYYPVISLFIALGLMIGTGANAYIVSLIGKKETEKANQAFSDCIIFIVGLGIVIGVICVVFADPFMRMLGATDITIPYLRPYYRTLSACALLILLQSVLGNLIIGEGKMVLAAVLSIIGGILNCVLDYVFMKYFHWNIQGAALATAIGYAIPVVYGFWYYFIKRKSIYHFQWKKISFSVIGKMSFNGSSEFFSNIASGITAFFMNHMILRYQNEIGISALTVLQYIQVFITMFYMGFCTAAAPVFSFYDGSGEITMRKRVFRICLIWITIFSVGISVVLFVTKDFLIGLFFAGGDDAYLIAQRGYLLFLGGSLFVGINTFASSVFTAFSNGLISAVLSVSRTMIIFIGMIFLLDFFFGETGVWSAWTVTEAISVFISLFFLLRYRKRYQW